MKTLAHTRKALLEQIGRHSECVRGSITSVCAACNRTGCICEKRIARRAYRLTYKDKGQKTRIVYIPRKRLPMVRKMIANYAKLRQLIEELIAINIAVFKEEARH